MVGPPSLPVVIVFDPWTGRFCFSIGYAGSSGLFAPTVFAAVEASGIVVALLLVPSSPCSWFVASLTSTQTVGVVFVAAWGLHGTFSAAFRPFIVVLADTVAAAVAVAVSPATQARP